ncbi:hypothetical protein BG00_04700 [Pseudoalteromonas sp. SCSIO_11900]|nr:hypothetical protein BG00_04700 [Pseudoalteromonas sp. SCSIO_11900]
MPLIFIATHFPHKKGIIHLNVWLIYKVKSTLFGESKTPMCHNKVATKFINKRLVRVLITNGKK